MNSQKEQREGGWVEARTLLIESLLAQSQPLSYRLILPDIDSGRLELRESETDISWQKR